MEKNGTMIRIPGHLDDFDRIYEHTHRTPVRDDAFERTDEEKIRLISRHFKEIMEILGLDLSDDSLRDTPDRVARMYVNEIFNGLDPGKRPEMKMFKNKYRYHQMLVERNIKVYSTCEHHFVPILGRAHIAYIPGAEVIGLSKLHRLVKYYCQRPQVQERLTMQIAEDLKQVLDTEDVAVLIEARHLCVSARGVGDAGGSTVTTQFSGKFNREDIRNEFLSMIK